MLRISCTQREVYATTLALGKFARSDRSQSTVSISFKSERCRVFALQTKRYHLSDLHSTYETLLWFLCPNKEHSSSAFTAPFPQRCNFGLSRKRAQQAITEHYVTKAEAPSRTKVQLAAFISRTRRRRRTRSLATLTNRINTRVQPQRKPVTGFR